MLAPPTGGGATSPVSVASLSDSYYLRHVGPAREGGMAAVIAAEGAHYATTAGRSGATKAALLATDAAEFAACREQGETDTGFRGFT